MTTQRQLFFLVATGLFLVYLMTGMQNVATNQVADLAYSDFLAEVQNGQVLSAAMGPVDAFPRATWIQIHSPGVTFSSRSAALKPSPSPPPPAAAKPTTA